MKEYIKNGKKELPKKWHRYNMICRKEENTKEHVLDCEVELEKGKHTIGSSNINHWKQILNIFRENKNKRKAQM